MTWGTPPTFTALGAATAAMFNQLRDNFNAIGDSAGTYTPTVTASTTNPTQGTSTVAGRYRNAGKWWDVHIDWTIGASGFATGSGVYRFSLPSGLTPLLSNAGEAMGIGTIRDASAGANRGIFAVYYVSSTTVSLFDSGGAVSNAYIGIAAAPAAGDVINLHMPCVESV